MLRELRTRTLCFIATAILLCGADPVHGVDLVGRFVGGWARDVEVRDGYAYIADSNGFLVLDVSDPTSPRLVACDLTVKANAVELRGRYAFLAPLRVYDIGDPVHPIFVGDEEGWDSGDDISIQGDYAYIASSLKIIDISDLAHPYEVSWISLPDFSVGLDVAGSYAYVAAREAGLRVVDVSDPASPVEVGYIDTPGSSQDVEVVGNFAYLSDGPVGLSVLDITDPTNPVEVGYKMTRGWSIKINLSGKRAYLGDGPGGGAIIDISNPAKPYKLGQFDTPGSAHSVFGLGDYAYVADSHAGLRIYDISDPDAAFEVGNYNAPGFATGVDVGENYAYVVENDYHLGLSIIDISDPGNPREVGAVATDGRAQTVDHSDGLAYVVDDTEGLVIVDVSDPESPRETASLFSGDYVSDVFVQEELAYVTANVDSSLRIINVGDPSGPVEVGRFDLGMSAGAVFVSGGHAYVACRDSGLVIVDISEPTAPEQAGRFRHDCYEPTLDVYVSGDYAYLANDDCGLIIVYVRSPLWSREVGRLEGNWRAHSVTGHGDYVYVGSSPGLRVIDVRDPRHPVQVDSYAIPGYSRGIPCYSDGNVFIAERSTGLWVLKYTEPHYIRGHVRDVSGRGIAGTAVMLSGESSDIDTTDTDGFFEFTGLKGGAYGDYAVASVRTGWTFEPPARRYSGIYDSLEGQDFIGAPTTAGGDVRIVGGEEGYVRPNVGESATVIVNPRDSGPISVMVYSMNGMKVWSLTDMAISGEEKRITWDCRNSDGNVVASGVYLVRVTSGGLDARGHVAIIK